MIQSRAMLVTVLAPQALSLPVGVLLVLHVQILERGDEGLGLEAAGSPCGDGGVADGAVGADGEDVAPQRGARVSRPVPRLRHTAHVDAAAEVDAVQHLETPQCDTQATVWRQTHTRAVSDTHTHSPCD